MKTLRLISIFIIFVTSLSFSQGMRGGTIQFDLDMATFSGSQGFSYLEIYFSLPRDAITHAQKDDGYVARFQTMINMFRGDSLLNSKVDAHSDLVQSLEEITPQQKLHSLFPFYLKSNDYRIRFQVTDLETGQSGWLERPLIVPEYAMDSLCVSSIELGTEILPDTSKNPFVKNGYRIIPNASSLYGVELPILFYYAEIYGLSSIQAGLDSNYTTTILVEDSEGKIVKRGPEKSKKRMGNSLVDLGKIHVAGLRSGSYSLVMGVRDHATGDSISAKKGFVIYRRADYMTKSSGTEATTDRVSEFEAMPEDVLDEQFAFCEYLATKNEKKTFKKCDLAGKREFLKNFWQQRDENPVTAINETKNRYFNRINQSNLRFGNRSDAGWKTDQGRIYILYGEPDDVDRLHNDLNQRYYEIWHYYQLEGGVQFIFIDIQDYGDIRLVHSSHTKEIHDYQWRRWLSK